jgi:hypothetical protein
VPVTYPIMHRLERLALATAYIALTRVMVDSAFGKKPIDHSLLLIGSAIGRPRRKQTNECNEDRALCRSAALDSNS